MGNNISTKADEDEKRLTEQSINESLGFYRNWSMTDVAHIFKSFKSYHQFRDLQEDNKGIANLHPNSVKLFSEVKVPWSEYYSLVYETDSNRIQESDSDRRKMYHPCASMYAMNSSNCGRVLSNSANSKSSLFFSGISST